MSGTTRVSRYQEGKPIWILMKQESEWQWHQLGHMHMQVCTLLQTDNHTSTHHSFFTGRMPFLPPNQQRQSTEGTTVKVKTVLHFENCALCFPVSKLHVLGRIATTARSA